MGSLKGMCSRTTGKDVKATRTGQPSSSVLPNQNNHQAVTVTFDGSNVVTTTDNFTHHNTSSLASGNPADAANCPPGGCILEAPDPVNTGKVIDYRFCDSANGCDQSGIPNRKCGTGPNAGLACTANGDCPQTMTGGGPEVGQTVSMVQFLNAASGIAANDSSFNGACTITVVSGNGYSCAMTNGVDVNIASHNPNSPKTCGINGTNFCDSTASFAPISAGTYAFWVGARDGAFQVARGPVTVVVGP